MEIYTSFNGMTAQNNRTLQHESAIFYEVTAMELILDRLIILN